MLSRQGSTVSECTRGKEEGNLSGTSLITLQMGGNPLVYFTTSNKIGDNIQPIYTSKDDSANVTRSLAYMHRVMDLLPSLFITIITITLTPSSYESQHWRHHHLMTFTSLLKSPQCHHQIAIFTNITQPSPQSQFYTSASLWKQPPPTLTTVMLSALDHQYLLRHYHNAVHTTLSEMVIPYEYNNAPLI